MKEIKFVTALSLQEDNNVWYLNSIDPRSRSFIPDSVRHNHISLVKVLSNFKDGDHLEIRIRKVKKK